MASRAFDATTAVPFGRALNHASLPRKDDAARGDYRKFVFPMLAVLVAAKRAVPRELLELAACQSAFGTTATDASLDWSEQRMRRKQIKKASESMRREETAVHGTTVPASGRKQS